MYNCIFRDLDPAVFQCQVQICTYPDLDRVQESQAIQKDQWGQWDIKTIAENEAEEYQDQGIQFDIVSIHSVDSESTIPYEIDADMIIDHDLVECESVQSMNEVPELPEFDDVRAELNVLGGTDSPPADFVMPTDYYPASPIYSPASPSYSPSMSPNMSPLTVNTDNGSEHGFTPPQQDSPIVTRGVDIFTLPNEDSDNDLDREVELINMMSSYINRNRIPLQINGVFIFPQNNNVHNLQWIEYQDQPCTDHCVIPNRRDKSFAKFYLTHSLCLKHRSNLSTLGPWIYLTSKVSTLTKIHKCPQITHFIVMLNNNIRRDQRVRDYLAACHLTENNGTFTLMVRLDVYMTNNPHECKYWTQTYCVNDHVLFGEKTMYYLQRDVSDVILDLHVNR